MKGFKTFFGLGILLAASMVLATRAEAQPSIPNFINFLGRLDSAGAPIPNGTHSVNFAIWTLRSGGASLWNETATATTSGGIFMHPLGSVISLPTNLFDSNDSLFLEITVGSEVLTPRTALTSVGYARRVQTVNRATGGTIFGDVSIQSDLTISGKATIGPGHTNTGTNAFIAGDGNTASGNWATVSGGLTNAASAEAATVSGGKENAASGTSSTVGGGDLNSATDSKSTVGGGQSNIASDFASTVGGGQSNTSSGSFSTIGGGEGNRSTGAATTVGGGTGNKADSNFTTIGGGEGNEASRHGATVGGGQINTASGEKATVGGGAFNAANGVAATVGGGKFNNARGQFSVVSGGGGVTAFDSNSAQGPNSTIGGGRSNIASAIYATVGGGVINTASNQSATVGGGQDNRASGFASTVPGGNTNKASGNYSFAAGRRAKANHLGSFVWADSNDIDFASSANNQFNVRAGGGTRIYSDASLTAGVTLAAGASAWVAVSDSNLKRNIRTLDGKEMLDKVMQLPIKRWSYKAQDPNIEHIGPMAQDFYPLFQVGDDEKTISTIDPPGIALAAIQGLYQIVQEHQVENDELRRELKDLRELVQTLLAEKEEKSAKTLTVTK